MSPKSAPPVLNPVSSGLLQVESSLLCVVHPNPTHICQVYVNLTSSMKPSVPAQLTPPVSQS